MNVYAPGFAGMPFRITERVRPGEMLVLGVEPFFGKSLFPAGRQRQEVLLNFETYWLMRYGNSDPWWAGFGVRLHRLTRQRIDSSRSL